MLFDGRDITGLPPHRVSRLGIVRKFQVPGIYPSLAVAENLEIPCCAGAREQAPGPDRARTGQLRSVLHGLLERFGLERHAARPAGALAHGQKQWLEIAMLLAADARLLLLDEPTAGMSAAETSATVELIRRIRDEHGAAVLVIEHDMSFVRQLDCPVSVMIRGTVRYAGSYARNPGSPRGARSLPGSGGPMMPESPDAAETGRRARGLPRRWRGAGRRGPGDRRRRSASVWSAETAWGRPLCCAR